MSQLEIIRDGSIYTMETSKHIKLWKLAKKTQTLKNASPCQLIETQVQLEKHIFVAELFI